MYFVNDTVYAKTLVIINFILKMETSFTVLIFQNLSEFFTFEWIQYQIVVPHKAEICVVLGLKKNLIKVQRKVQNPFYPSLVLVRNIAEEEPRQNLGETHINKLIRHVWTCKEEFLG